MSDHWNDPYQCRRCGRFYPYLDLMGGPECDCGSRSFWPAADGESDERTIARRVTHIPVAMKSGRDLVSLTEVDGRTWQGRTTHVEVIPEFMRDAAFDPLPFVADELQRS